MRNANFCCLALGLLAALPVSADPPAALRPNIVVILADDLGWSDLGCYGSEIPTPHLDRLAAGGLRFTQFYNNAVCGPSRASLLTGLYCQQVGYLGSRWTEPTDFTRCVTFGEVLQSAGYRTMMVGKWQDEQLPPQRGFDRFFGPLCRNKMSYFHEVAQNPYYLDEQRWQVPEDFYFTEAITDRAVQFVEEAGAKRDSTGRPQPFMLYVAHIAPHWPLHARETEIAPHRERYRQNGWDHCRAERIKRQRTLGLLPASWTPAPRPAGVHAWETDKHQAWQAERMAVYAAQVASIDASTGRILAAIRQAGADKNTLVLFLSDNGAAPDGGVLPTETGFSFTRGKVKREPWRIDRVPIRPGSGPDVLPGPADTFAAYGLGWTHVSNTPFRSTKGTAYEGGIRTPLIAHWPAAIENPGGLVHAVGHLIDLLPTCLELAGARYPSELPGRRPLPLEGRSFAPALRGEQYTGHDELYWRVPQNQAARVGNWKLVNARDGAAWELYDLTADGGETKNLAAENPEVVRDLAQRWQQWTARCARQP